jgi:uncharacterized membrane protein YhiD involved in acid resistance
MGFPEDALSSIRDNKEKEEVGAGGWIGALIAAILVMIAAAIFGFIAWSKGKELAKLKHEKAVSEEQEHQANVDSVIAVNEDIRRKALVKAAAAREKTKELEKARVKVEEDHREARKRIDEITSWDDVNSYLGSSPPS